MTPTGSRPRRTTSGSSRGCAATARPAEEVGSAALAEFQRTGNLQATATALVNLGACALYRGALSIGQQRLERRCRSRASSAFRRASHGRCTSSRSRARQARRPAADTAPMLCEALLIHRRLGDRWRASRACSRRSPVRSWPAATLAARSRCWPLPRRFASGWARRSRRLESADRDAVVDQLVRKLNVSVFGAAWADGRARGFGLDDRDRARGD